MKKIFFIGRFPPPYGGATIKCKMLHDLLNKKYIVEKFDTELKNKNKLRFFYKLIVFLLRNRSNSGVICINTNSLFSLTKILNVIQKNMIGNISVFVNGGSISEQIDEKNFDVSLLKNYKVLYVECIGMKEKLAEKGINNVEIIPNCRVTPNYRKFVCLNNEKIKCLFMSRIDSKKGVFKIINAFEKLEQQPFEVDFYGPLDKDIECEFLNKVENKTNIRYKGILDSNDEKVYSIINKYDILLFPTEYGEGYPGIISECRIAGIPVLTSEFTYSKEIIKNLHDGIIMEQNSVNELISSLFLIKKDRRLLNKMRLNSYELGEKCFIEYYLQKIEYFL